MGTISSLPTTTETPVTDNVETEAPKEQPAASEETQHSATSTESPAQTVPSQDANKTTPSTDTTAPATGTNSAPAASESPAATTPSETVSPERAKYLAITEALLGRIGDVGSKSTFKCCVYGPPGGTKSSWLGRIPNNLVYDMEDGVISMRTQEAFTGKPKAPGVKVIPFSSFNEADLLLQRFLDNDPAFAQWTVFSIDTFSDFHKRALEDLMYTLKRKQPSLNQYDVKPEHHAENNMRMMEYVRKLRNMPKDLVITAHARTVEPKGKPAKTYPDFSESLAGKIEAMMDVVGYMEMRLVDGKETPVMRVVSEGTIHAKTRVPLDAEIINPEWTDIKAVWEKWREENPDED